MGVCMCLGGGGRGLGWMDGRVVRWLDRVR